MTLVAQCANCTSWRHTQASAHATASEIGHCGQGLAPAPGALLCDRYAATPAFKQEIISSMLREHGPMAMPVRIVGGRKGGKGR